MLIKGNDGAGRAVEAYGQDVFQGELLAQLMYRLLNAVPPNLWVLLDVLAMPLRRGRGDKAFAVYLSLAVYGNGAATGGADVYAQEVSLAFHDVRIELAA